MSELEFRPAKTFWKVVETPKAEPPIGEVLSIDQIAELLEQNAYELAVRSVLAHCFRIDGFAFLRVHVLTYE